MEITVKVLKLLGGTTHSLHVKSSLIDQWGLLSATLQLLTPTKLWEGNVFTNVCLSTGDSMMSFPGWLLGPMFILGVFLQEVYLRGGGVLAPKGQVQGLPPRGGGPSG